MDKGMAWLETFLVWLVAGLIAALIFSFVLAILVDL